MGEPQFGPIREWLLFDTRAGDPIQLVEHLTKSGFDAFIPRLPEQMTVQDTGADDALFPGHFLVFADPDYDASMLNNYDPKLQVITNDKNRPMPVPGTLVEALRGTSGEEEDSLRRSLASHASEYRMDLLKIAITRWR